MTVAGENTWKVWGAEFSQEFFSAAPPTEREAARMYDTTKLLAFKARREALDTSIAELEARLAPAPWSSLREGDSQQYTVAEHGDDAFHGLEIYRDEEGVRATGTINLDFEDVFQDAGIPDPDGYLNRHGDRIEAWIQDNYGATLTGDMWDSQDVEFVADLTDTDVNTAPAAAGAVRDNTRIIELHNDLNGAYGTGHLYGLFTRLRMHLDEADQAAE